MDDNEPDDVEYNFLTEEEPEEVEEFRNDKAVRISRKFDLVNYIFYRYLHLMIAIISFIVVGLHFRTRNY